ncbi:hypothetical protein V1478_002932 [Vespula squamosa]|uniref:Uncharacterized protein n=1 Tax=Vespula squamosa TaxID=30214 RepID=A0ABD2BR89_VESSQ
MSKTKKLRNARFKISENFLYPYIEKPDMSMRRANLKKKKKELLVEAYHRLMILIIRRTYEKRVIGTSSSRIPERRLSYLKWKTWDWADELRARDRETSSCGKDRIPARNGDLRVDAFVKLSETILSSIQGLIYPFYKTQSKLDSLNPRATEDKDGDRPQLIDEKMFAAIEDINQRTSKLYSHESDLLNSIIVVVEDSSRESGTFAFESMSNIYDTDLEFGTKSIEFVE